MTAFANVNGETVINAVLHVPNIGPWWAEVVFETAPELSGQVTLAFGALELTGTISPDHDGTFSEQRRSRIVGGASGWGSVVEAKHYHNDSGVGAQRVAQDAAREVGETIGAFNVSETSLGVDYVRSAGLASIALENAIKGTAWHVDYEGNTNVGERDTSEANANDYQVLDFDPREGMATLAVDDLTTIGVGSVISEGLDSDETISALRVEVSIDSVRVFAWTGGTLGARGRIAGALRGIVKRVNDDRLFGKYRYRVVQMSGDRVELQAVRQAAGLPDILPVSMTPGVAGAHVKLAGGSVVLVEFIEGDRSLPIISAFAGKDGTGHEPSELDFSVTATMRLGSDSASEGVPLGDSLKSWLDGHTHMAGTNLTAPSGGGTVTGFTGPPGAASPDTSPDPSSKVKVE